MRSDNHSEAADDAATTTPSSSGSVSVIDDHTPASPVPLASAYYGRFVLLPNVGHLPKLIRPVQRKVGVPVRYRMEGEHVVIPVAIHGSKEVAERCLRDVREFLRIFDGKAKWEQTTNADAPITVISVDAGQRIFNRIMEAERQREGQRLQHEQEQRRAADLRLAVYNVERDPGLRKVFHRSDPRRTVAMFVYLLARTHGAATKEATQAFLDAEASQRLRESGLIEALPPADWDEELRRATRAAVRSYKPPTRAFPFGMYVDALRREVPEAELTTRSGARTLAVTHEDLDIALIRYTLGIIGKGRDRQVGFCKRDDVIKFFRATKKYTGRGCSKPKANHLYQLLLKRRFVAIFNPNYCFGKPGTKKHEGIRSITYKLGERHPEYRGPLKDGWDLVI